MQNNPLTPEAAALALADAVAEAGRHALAMLRAGVKTWNKANASPVTDADLALDRLLRERLNELAPGYGWLSEECPDDPARLNRARVWMVDPIDGTRAYVAGHPDWSVVAALIENGRPIAAALYAPAGDELFAASIGRGATLNGAPIRTSPRRLLDGARIAGTRSSLDALLRAGNAILPQPRIHSLALRFARVAQGELDAALAGADSHDWDLAAADLLVHEAGGMLTELSGAGPLYNRPQPVHGALAAAGAGLHPALIAALGAIAPDAKRSRVTGTAES
jgi:myo-inositol-1(or 4)-monophosphatase